MKSSPPAAPSLRIPWWATLAMAIISYVLFKYIFVQLTPEHPALVKFCAVAPTFAPIVAIFFLLLAAKQLYDGESNQESCINRENGNNEAAEDEHNKP